MMPFSLFSSSRQVSLQHRKPCSFYIWSGAVCALGLVFVLAGCKPAITDPKDPHFIFAEVNGQKITRADLDKEADAQLKEAQARNPGLTKESMGPAQVAQLELSAIKYLVVKNLLLQRASQVTLPDVEKAVNDQIDQVKAREQEITKSPTALEDALKQAGHDLDWLKATLRERVTIKELLDAEVFKNTPPVTEAEIEDFYHQNEARFQIQEKLRASRVLVMVPDNATPAQLKTAEDKIKKAQIRIRAGEDFAKVAQAVSEDQYTAPRGGDMGFFEKQENEAGFDANVWQLKPGVVSPIFRTALGFQIVKVTDHTPARLLTIAELSAKISERLTEQKKIQELQDYEQKITTAAQVIYHTESLQSSGATSAGNAPVPPVPSTK